jgi:hypothetical protein
MIDVDARFGSNRSHLARLIHRDNDLAWGWRVERQAALLRCAVPMRLFHCW